jgi:hypothetical protein
MNSQTDFEQWAKLLLTRKVPSNFNHLINSEVIHSGAEILKRGDAFEVHLETPAAHERVFVTPLLPRAVRSYAN